MADVGALLFSQADRDHFLQSAFHRPAEGDMRLDAVGEDGPVGIVGVLVEVYREAVLRYSHLNRRHVGEDRRADIFLRIPHADDHVPLALSRGSAVASHGRNQKRLGADFFQFLNQGFDQQRHIADSPAANRHGHPLPRFDFAQDAFGLQFGSEFCRDIRNQRPVELLTHPDYLGYRYGIKQFVDRAHSLLLLCLSDF